MTAPPPQRRIIRASELGQYAYCARAWWLQRVAGVAPTNNQDLAAGTAAHQQHGRLVWLAGALRWAAVALIALAIVAALIG
ncbi:MAG: hypothetical protein ABIQ99_12815 [Thermoflexales bacterium]